VKTRIADENRDADALLPPGRPDGSRIGVNYADAYLKAFAVDLADGRKVIAKRKGLKITLQIGERKGEGLMRRLAHGPDAKAILVKAIEEAAAAAGSSFSVDEGVLYLEV
jgi:hypothetical protein